MQDLIAWQDVSGADKVLYSALIVLVAWIIWFLVTRLVNRGIEDLVVRYKVRKGVSYGLVALAILVVAALWIENLSSLATFIGLVSAGLAIALHDVFVNIAGWLYIVWRRPFKVGDRIEIGGLVGDVVDIRVLHFQLLEIGNWVVSDQSTGRVIHVPCGKSLNEPMMNYSQGLQFIWNEIPVLITFESDWRDAKRILGEIADRHAADRSERAEADIRAAADGLLIQYENLTPTVYTAVREMGVELTVRYLCRPQRRRGSEEEIWEEILDAFDGRDDLDFAYPTRRNIQEPRHD